MHPVSRFFTALLIAFCGWLSAAEFELTIRPRAIETPVLKYQLLPAESELKDGNAAPILLRLPWEQTNWMNKVFPTLHEWESRPLSAPEWITSDGVLPQNFYEVMKRAAFRRSADWEYPLRETEAPYLILVPDLHGLRGFLASGLSARIRYHLTRRELDQAREGILVGLADARHIAQTPFYISQFVAALIHRTMLERIAELIEQPNSPNLYWALSSLPDSLLEMDRAASYEANLFATSLPAANNLDRPRNAAEWRSMVRQLFESGAEDLFKDIDAHWTSLARHARTELPKLLDVSAERIAAMSDDEAGIRWYVFKRLARDQRISATLMLKPREAWPHLKQLQDDAKLIHERIGARAPELSQLFNPTYMYITTWSLKRRIAALRIIEAVRHHLATHDGKLPATLDDIKDVSIPLDPLTDQVFRWKVDVDPQVAILTAPALPQDVVRSGSELDQSSRLEFRLPVRN